MTVEQKVALITGVSAGGLGYGVALSLLSKDWTVYGTLRSMSKAGDLASKGVHILLCDITSTAEINKAVDQLLSETSRLDLLVNSASYGAFDVLAEADLSGAQKLFDTNVFGTIRMIQAATPALIKSKGTIVNVGSVSGYRGIALQGIYSSSKAAVHALTDSLRCELKALGVKVVLVIPGVIKSVFRHNEVQLTDPTNSKFFSNLQEAFDHRTKNRPVGMDQQKFCDQMVAVITKCNPPNVWTAGEGALVIYLATWFPSWMVDKPIITGTGTNLLKGRT